MFYVPLSIMFIIVGFVFYFLTELMPILRLIYFDYIALGFLAAPCFILLYVMSSKRVLWFLEKVPKGKMLMFFLRRDGDMIPAIGTRAYPGESFIDVPRLGLIHDLGNVYRFGQNNVRFALENVNHTADPSYANFMSWIYSLGFNNIQELQACIKGEYNERKAEVMEKLEEKQIKPKDILLKEIEEKVDGREEGIKG